MVAPHRRYQINGSKVVHDTIDGDVVLINVETGNYYQLSQVGTEVWRCLGLSMGVDEIIDTLASVYRGDRNEIEVSTCRLIDELVNEELIAPLPPNEDSHSAVATAVRAAADGADRPPYAAPVLQKYTDLQGILLLDPIHGVDEQGWPVAKPGNDG